MKIWFISFLFLFLNPNSYADIYRIINKGPEALQMRIDLIEQAKHEILISTFIFDDDKVGLPILALLREAAQRGVEIKIIVDDMCNWIEKPMRFYAFEQGIKIRNYNRFLFWKPSSWTKRSHDKIMLIDGEKLVMGGRNIEDVYYDQNHRENFTDRDVYIEGNLTAQVRDYFLMQWDSSNVEYELIKNVKSKRIQEEAQKMDKALSALYHHPVFRLNTQTDWGNGQTQMDGDVFFLHDPVNRKNKKNRVKSTLAALFHQAQESIKIETPYIVLNKEMKELIEATLKRGVKISITTTNLNTTDSLLTQAIYLGQKKQMVKMGVELFEYNGPYMFHSKSVVIDDEIALIGSYNMDPRSQNLNTETLSGIKDKVAAEALLESFEYNLSQSYRINAKGKPEHSGLNRYANASAGKVIAAQVLRFTLAPLIKGQL